MSPTAHDVTQTVARSAGRCLDQCFDVISHCVGQLSEEQCWWRPQPEMNSVGNLLLHLAGNLRQWIVAGISEETDQRNRPEEFRVSGGISKTELLNRLEETIDDAKAVILTADADQMLKVRTIQEFQVSGWDAVFDSIPHFKGHTQEVVFLTRLQLGSAYRFHWKPASARQGANSENQ